MFRRPIKEINAEFIAEEKYLDGIQRTVRESCIAASMSKKEIAAVMLAIEEGATNIIRHAYLYEKGIIRLRVVIYKKLVIFSLIDFGRSFQPGGSGTFDLQRLVESGRKGGLGFYMIQKIMDSVEYISTAGFNELRMIKRIGDTAPVSRSLLRRMFTLRVKFSVWTFIIMSIIIGGSIYYFDFQTSRQMYVHKDETVKSLAKTIADQAAGYFINRRSDVEFDELIVSYRRANPELKLIVLTDDQGIIRAHSDDIHNIRKPYEDPPGVSPSIEGVPQPLRYENENMQYLNMPIMTGEKLLGEVHVTYSSAAIYNKLREARQRILILTVILVMFGILGIYLLSNYFVNPIHKITNRIRRFTSGDLETEMPLEGAEEFFEISKAFNQMMTRLSQDRRNIIEREKMAKEIEVASQIQKTLLPNDLPAIPHLEIDAFYRAASIVGGDLYDLFKVSEDRYCLVVADVSGKGVPASLVMSMLRTVIQIYSADAQSARHTLIKVHHYLKDNIPPGMFVTVLLVIYDATSRSINFVSAGHNPMLFYRAGRKAMLQVNPKGMPLGLPETEGTSFERILEEVTMQLEDDDLFFIFTDGITEAKDRDGQVYGMPRLKELLERILAEDEQVGVAEISKRITADIDDFTGFVKAHDDITFILSRCHSAVAHQQPVARSIQPSVDVRNVSDRPSQQ